MEMKPTPLIVAALLVTGPLWGAEQCVPHETSVIDSEVRCVNDGGISIGEDAEEAGAKVACMQAQKVKTLCGADGQITRIRAYGEWFGKLKRFQDECAAEGGTFAFQDPTFVEPHNESYCLQAVPEIGSSMFEEPLCNYRSLCPAVAVTCERTCSEATIARLF